MDSIMTLWKRCLTSPCTRGGCGAKARVTSVTTKKTNTRSRNVIREGGVNASMMMGAQGSCCRCILKDMISSKVLDDDDYEDAEEFVIRVHLENALSES